LKEKKNESPFFGFPSKLDFTQCLAAVNSSWFGSTAFAATEQNASNVTNEQMQEVFSISESLSC
jgi:hypothetical protein